MIRYMLLQILFVIGLVAGCSSQSDSVQSTRQHKHDNEFQTMADAMKELTSLRNRIRDAFAAEDSEGAHDPLHDVGEVIEAIPALAEKEKLSAEQMSVVTSQAEVLMDLFGAVDATMHGQVGPAYADVSRQIDEAIEKLTAASAVDPSPSSKNGPGETDSREAVLQRGTSGGKQPQAGL